MNNKLIFLTLCVLFSVSMNGQEAPGIRFEKAESWQQIMKKAKIENKYVFVDCYTTWCAPCKKMDKEVYPLKKVGDFFNNRFISVKIQMDTSEADGQDIQNLYADAVSIKNNYEIDGFPTFLFFSPDGALLNKSTGRISPDELIGLGGFALNPQSNYYQMLRKFNEGARGMNLMNFLAQQGLKIGDTTNASFVAQAYFSLLKKADWFKKENIELMTSFTKSSLDKGFYIFYNYTDTINKVVDNNNYAQSVIHSVIYKEMIAPFIGDAAKRSTTPSWNVLQSKIRAKYNQYYADRVITLAKVGWNQKNKNWEEYTKYLILYHQKYSSFKKGFVDSNSFEPLIWNNRAWQVFLYSNKPQELKIALEWSKYAVMMEPDPNWMDTYANLLYKLGQQKLAAQWEKIAIATSNINDPNRESFKNNLEKINRGEPTWDQF